MSQVLGMKKLPGWNYLLLLVSGKEGSLAGKRSTSPHCLLSAGLLIDPPGHCHQASLVFAMVFQFKGEMNISGLSAIDRLGFGKCQTWVALFCWVGGRVIRHSPHLPGSSYIFFLYHVKIFVVVLGGNLSCPRTINQQVIFNKNFSLQVDQWSVSFCLHVLFLSTLDKILIIRFVGAQ